MRFSVVILAAAVAASMVTNTLAAECGLIEQFRHPHLIGKDKDKKDIIKNVPIYGGAGGLFFSSDMAVNTDGAITSYHPDDLAGTKGLAINTICNGANAVMPDGDVIKLNRCQELIDAVRESRKGDWIDPKRPKIDFFAVATKSGVPCILKDGSFKGYFVSTTSLAADSSKDVCDPARWLDALTVPFLIFPGNSEFVKKGVQVGDLAVVYHPGTKKKVYAIVGDQGPKLGLAEGSVAISKILLGRKNPTTLKESYGLTVPGAKVIFFPGKKAKAPYTAASIEKAGASVLKDWGGEDRLKKCAEELK